MGSDDTDSRRARMPLPRFFAWVGYAVVSVVVVAALIEAAAYAFLSIERALRGGPLARRCPCYEGQAWATEYFAEQARRKKDLQGGYVPFRIWGTAPFRGNQINVDSSSLGPLRRTSNAPKQCAGKRVFRVWFFGGSTAFGLGAPDWATAPSYLSSLLNANGRRCFEVSNLGVEGYGSNQEVLLLVEKLKEGHRPDEVVFFDGINDAFVGGVAGDARAHMGFGLVKSRIENRWRNRLDFLNESHAMVLVERAVARPRAPETTRTLDERARATLDNYLANVRIVRLLADEHHFVPHFFWQPALYAGKKSLTPYEMEVARNDELSPADRRDFRAGIGAVYAEADRRSAAADFAYLGRLFDESREPLYIDSWMHLCPRGNELVAEFIARSIESDALAGQ